MCENATDIYIKSALKNWQNSSKVCSLDNCIVPVSVSVYGNTLQLCKMSPLGVSE